MATQQITGRQIKAGIITDAHVASNAAIDSSKLAAFSQDRNAGGFKLTNLANATVASDAVNYGQLQTAITASSAGLAIKQPVRVASTTNITGTYNATGGVSARGQLTAMPNSVDGISLTSGDRVLLKDQTAPAENGIWIVTTAGSGSNGTWDRATDADGDAEVTDGTAVMVGEGTQSATQWVLTTNAPITVGGASGSSLTFVQFGGGQTYTADESTLTVSANQFSIKALGVGTAQLAADAVTNAKLADNAVQQENLADSSVGTAELIDLNVTAGKLANNAVTTVKILDENVTTEKLAANAVTAGKIAFISQTVTGTPNDVLTDFTTSAAASPESLIVWINGLRQRPIEHFSYTGNTITFTSAPETDDDIAVFGVIA